MLWLERFKKEDTRVVKLSKSLLYQININAYVLPGLLSIAF
jgi:hypothetical protein